METDFTVVGKIRNHENILRLIKGIEKKGYSVYNFLSRPVVPEHAEKSLLEQADILESVEDFWSDQVHIDHFERDLSELKKAKALILLLPAGIASHTEAGVAFGLGKRLILIGEAEKPETLYLMFKERYKTIEDFLDSL